MLKLDNILMGTNLNENLNKIRVFIQNLNGIFKL